MALILALVLTILTSESYADEDNSLQEVSKSNIQFANDLYAVVSKEEPGNLFFSPFSIQTILALTYLGARGSTAQQMEEGLRLPGDQDATKYGFRTLLGDLRDSADVILSVANKIYLDKRFTPNTSFIKTALQFFNSGLESVDFMYSYELVRQYINSWVQDNTNDKIQDLLPRGFVDASTVMVLVNAVYFKGAWDWFDKPKTSPRLFYANGVTPVTVPMMYGDKYVNYKDLPNIRVQVLELPYNGEEISFIVILPYGRDGLYDLEARLPNLRLSDLALDMPTRKVQVSLPKFVLQQSLDLEDTLVKLGMVDIFGYRADLSGISKQQLAVSKVVHKAYIDVNERGTEAAAATGVGIMLLSMPTNPIRFVADHPFIFFVRHNPTNTILFMGRYSEPEGAAGSVKTNPMPAWPAQWSWRPYYC